MHTRSKRFGRNRLVLTVCLLTALSCSVRAQQADAGENTLSIYFKGIYGTWEAVPEDSSFVSRLTYAPGEHGFLVTVSNTLKSANGAILAEYDGVYLYDPVEDQITFTTVTGNQVHRGTSRVRGDTLFHEAVITGAGNIRSYSSAIVKMDERTLNYYAEYSGSDTLPSLRFETPLIYKKEASAAITPAPGSAGAQVAADTARWHWPCSARTGLARCLG